MRQRSAAGRQAPLSLWPADDITLKCIPLRPLPPTTHIPRSQSKLPLGLVIQAMALDSDFKDGGLKVVNFGAQVRFTCSQAVKQVFR